MKIDKKKIAIVTFMVLAVITALYFLNFFYCRKAAEIKAYLGKGSGYYLGPAACPATWGLHSIKVAGIKDLPKDKETAIATERENSEIEKELSNNFLGYNKFIAGEGNQSFIIYESICKACELNK